ncbi:MAG: tRNA pseudouridine(13) synthase TruD [Planctomycetes bacterium]|nr:tRNA pseudouridine(13) synthase TruD [Planctomycetota bacterium]
MMSQLNEPTVASVASPTSHFETLPFLTADIPAIPAAIKRRYEDFVVEEIPAYEPCGVGDHIYFTIEKKGLATMRAVNDIARALGVQARDIGLAGLKDARAVTTQMLSIEHMDPEKIRALNIPRIKIVNITRHKNKLKIGHLRGNKFKIRLRDIAGDRMTDIRTICDTLVARGVPNYFGRQRFGSRGDTWQIGRAVLCDDRKETVDLILGRPGPFDTGEVLRARQLYESGDYENAAKAWPYGFRDNVRMCRELARTNGKHQRAYHAIDQRLKKFYVNAFQSYLFNLVLARRITNIDTVLNGDLAYKHENGAVFRVDDAAAEAPPPKPSTSPPPAPSSATR